MLSTRLFWNWSLDSALAQAVNQYANRVMTLGQSTDAGHGLPFPNLVSHQTLPEFQRTLVMHLMDHSSLDRKGEVTTAEQDPGLFVRSQGLPP